MITIIRKIGTGVIVLVAESLLYEAIRKYILNKIYGGHK
jgi:hypothetical protein